MAALHMLTDIVVAEEDLKLTNLTPKQKLIFERNFPFKFCIEEHPYDRPLLPLYTSVLLATNP